MNINGMKLKNHWPRAVFVLVLLACVAAALPAQDTGQANDPFVLFLPFGYEGVWLSDQTVHRPSAGIGFMLGEQDVPFTEVERRILGMALYWPYISTKEAHQDVPKLLHEVGGMFDGRFGRHQVLAIFQSTSDLPVFGGLNTFQFGAGYGYEVVRRPQISLILGALLGVSDFSTMGVPSPVLPLPLIRLGVDTRWFESSMDIITGPNLSFTVAPEERFRLTGDIRTESYRSIADINCEFTLWYRLFSPDHRMGDFAGVGVGFMNEVTGFDLSNKIQAEKFELQKASVFAAADLSFLTIMGGYVINSNYLVDDQKIGSPGKGFFLSVQGMIPIINRQ